jgi:hypothetical protein
MKKSMLAAGLLLSSAAFANVPITGSVASKCVINVDTPGVYGNPSPSVLSTDPADGGVVPVVRYDIISAEQYKAVLTYPDNFTSGPALEDIVNWEGQVVVSQTSDEQMAAFETNKVQYNNTTEYELTVAGSVWFDITSQADYGYGKSFPSGEYSATVTAECIAL